MLHVKDFKMTPDVTASNPPRSTEMGHGSIDYQRHLRSSKKGQHQACLCGAGRV